MIEGGRIQHTASGSMLHGASICILHHQHMPAQGRKKAKRAAKWEAHLLQLFFFDPVTTPGTLAAMPLLPLLLLLVLLPAPAATALFRGTAPSGGRTVSRGLVASTSPPLRT